jgi:hypothetical protein
VTVKAIKITPTMIAHPPTRAYRMRSVDVLHRFATPQKTHPPKRQNTTARRISTLESEFISRTSFLLE